MSGPSTTAPSFASGPARRAGSLAISTIIDQILSSASNALMVFVLAQVSSARHFGIIALTITLLAVCTGFNRGALGTPLLLTSNQEKNHQTVAEAGYATTWSLCSGVLAGVLVFIVAAAFHDPYVGLAFALALPGILAQDVLRLTAIALGRANVAVVADALWVVAMLGLFIANLFGVRESAECAIYLWGFSALFSAAILAVRLRIGPRLSAVLGWWQTGWAARVRFGGAYSVSQIGNVFVTLAAVTMAGSFASAGIRGAFTLFGPIAMLISAMPMVFVPHAARTGNSLADQWRLVSRTSMATSLLTLVATGCLMAVPERLGAAMLGDSWQATFPVIPYIGISSAALCWFAGVFTVCQSQGASKMTFVWTTLHIVVQVATCFAAGFVYGTATAIAFALALSASAFAVAGVLWLHRFVHTDAGPSRAQPGSAVSASEGIAS